jgi:hypothetical protein
VVPSRKTLEDRFAEIEARFAGQEVPCPPHWGGFRLAPTRIEFWQGRRSRLHDRIRYARQGEGWLVERVCPLILGSPGPRRRRARRARARCSPPAAARRPAPGRPGSPRPGTDAPSRRGAAARARASPPPGAAAPGRTAPPAPPGRRRAGRAPARGGSCSA